MSNNRSYIERFKNSREKHQSLRKQLTKREGTIDVEAVEKANMEAAQAKKAATAKANVQAARNNEKNAAPQSIVGKSIGLFTPLMKVDEEKREVTGMATNEAIDSYGDVVEFEAVKAALPDYLEFGNIREMHGPSAAGVVKSHDLNEKEKALYITVKVVDDAAWEKVKEKVYKGFSIGGYIEEAEPLMIEAEDDDGNKHEVYTGGFRITKIKLYEISLVDRPANPEALIESYKMAKSMEFIPERVFLAEAQLTGAMEKSIVEASHLHEQNKTISLQTSPMNEILSKAWAKVVEHFKKNNVDFEDVTQENVRVSLTKGEIKDLLKDAVEQAVSEEAPAEETPKEEETPKGDDEPKAVEEDTPKTTEGEETPKEEDAPKAKEEAPKAEEPKAEETDNAEAVAKAVAAALTPAFEKMGEVLTQISKASQANTDAIQKAVRSGAKSTQTGEATETSKSKGVFDGIL